MILDEEFGRYLEEIKHYIPFSSEEQIQVFIRYKNGENVLEEIFNRNSGLVPYIAKKYFKYVNSNQLTIMDIIQTGNIGLVKAIKSFDLSYKYTFSTWACKIIENEIRKYIHQYGYSIKMNYKLQNSLKKYKEKIDILMKELERIPTIEELASSLEISKEKVLEEQLIDMGKNFISLNTPITEDGDEMFLFLEDQNIEESNVDKEEIKQVILEALENSNLTEKEKEVIVLRYGLFDGEFKKYKEIAEKFGVTKQRIFQLEVTALKKIRNSKISYKLSLYTDTPYENLERIGKTKIQIKKNLKKY